MAFPDGKTAAQGGFGGYNYTERICQEYGQQPRYYNVRDEIAGSDWRSDGGWAIVQVRSTGTSYTFGLPIFIAGIPGQLPRIELAAPARERKQLTERSAGLAGFVIYNQQGDELRQVVVDRNNDGEITEAGDKTANVGGNEWEYRSWTATNYGAAWIRWADMRWCR